MSNRAWVSKPQIKDLIFEIPLRIQQLNYSRLPEWLPNQNIPEEFEEFRHFIQDKKSQLLSDPGVICFKWSNEADDRTLRKIYTYTASFLGTLNNRYGYLYDVVDTGADYKKNAIPVSQTKESTGFHTDSTSLSYFPSLVGLMCLQKGQDGGINLIANAENLRLFLEENCPESFELLKAPIIRDIITPGDENKTELILKNQFPVFGEDKKKQFTFRYMRYWIESAHAKVNRPMMKELTEALNIIDAYFADHSNVLSLELFRGDMLFINNEFLAHSRTAFTDSINQKRCFVRTWINEPEIVHS